MEEMYAGTKAVELTLADKSFALCFKFLLIGTEKFQLKQYLIKKNEDILALLTSVSDLSDADSR